jgi:hypothetical protein
MKKLWENSCSNYRKKNSRAEKKLLTKANTDRQTITDLSYLVFLFLKQ